MEFAARIRVIAVASTVIACLLSGWATAEGFRTSVASESRVIPVVVVKGTPYEMGYSLGSLTKTESTELLNRFLQLSQATGDARYSGESLDKAWATMEPYISERFKEEMRGLAEGAGIPLETVRRVHMIPVVSEYSCSSVALWGSATKDGHLYQTRNLDYGGGMIARAYEFPCIVVYLPDKGIPHFNVSFAGYIGSNTGMNAEGVVLSEIGDTPDSDYPFDLNGIHFSILFRDMLYDAHNLDEALNMMRQAKRIKKFHFVIGDGKTAKRAVKILQRGSEIVFWNDNDFGDELAPNVLKDGVYVDEGRGAFPLIMQALGKHDDQSLIEICKSIPIKGSNVLDVVYDATDLKLWVSYADSGVEAYQQPFVPVDLKPYLDYKPDARATIAEAAPAASPGAESRSMFLFSALLLVVPLCLIVGIGIWLYRRA